MSEASKPCPKCDSPYGYSLSPEMYACPECDHKWNPFKEAEETVLKVVDAHGNELQNGDTVMVIKNLPIKGILKPIKAGTKVKNIRLVDSDHNIDCRLEGYGAISLKSEFVKKV